MAAEQTESLKEELRAVEEQIFQLSMVRDDLNETLIQLVKHRDRLMWPRVGEA